MPFAFSLLRSVALSRSGFRFCMLTRRTEITVIIIVISHFTLSCASRMLPTVPCRTYSAAPNSNWGFEHLFFPSLIAADSFLPTPPSLLIHSSDLLQVSTKHLRHFLEGFRTCTFPSEMAWPVFHVGVSSL